MEAIREKWMLLQKPGDYAALGARMGVEPALLRLLRNRDVDVASEAAVRQYLDGGQACFHAPELLKDMDAACDAVGSVIDAGGRIRVIGDYDIDGVCASAILQRGLALCGAAVDVQIPHRVHDGYGMNTAMVEKAKRDGIALLLTCDNGIAAREEAALAARLGIRLVVTDHHEPPYVAEEPVAAEDMADMGASDAERGADAQEAADGERGADAHEAVDGARGADAHEAVDGARGADAQEAADVAADDAGRRYMLPEAEAIVDPKRPDCSYPFDSICGAFLAYKFILRLYERRGMALAQEEDERMLQLSAFATVGDVMELKDENRALVRIGLRLLRERPCGGLRELIAAQGLAGKEISVYHLGFVLGPCINATGRIDTPARALELLTTTDAVAARRIAEELKELNESRKQMTERAEQAAIAQVEAGLHDGRKVLVIYLPECHESIAGIVAGRVRERYGRPTLVITDADAGAAHDVADGAGSGAERATEDGAGAGAERATADGAGDGTVQATKDGAGAGAERIVKGSARSVPAYHMYDALTQVADVFLRYGGHAQAAGFSLERGRIDELRRRLNDGCTLAEEELGETLLIDMELPLRGVTAELVDALAALEPTGMGNPRARLARRGLALTRVTLLGKEGKVGRFLVEDAGERYELTAFRECTAICGALRERYGAGALREIEAGRVRATMDVVYHPQWNEYRGERSIQLVVDAWRLA